MSALLRRSSAVSPCPPLMAIPMLAAIGGRRCRQPHRLAERVGEADRDRHRPLLVADVVEQDRELVAPESGGRVGGPERIRDATRHRDEDVVAAGVAKGVVEHLEVVEVDEQDGERLAIATPAPLEGVVDPIAEEHRFASPVRPSCSAWWRISSYRRAFSSAMAPSPASIVAIWTSRAPNTPDRSDISSSVPIGVPAAISGTIAMLRIPIDAR